jgi:hypothetical protein
MAINQTNVATLPTSPQGAGSTGVYKAYVGHYDQTSYIDKVNLPSGSYVFSAQLLNTELNQAVTIRLDNPAGEPLAFYNMNFTGLTTTNFTVVTDYLHLNTSGVATSPAKAEITWEPRNSAITEDINALTRMNDNFTATPLFVAAGNSGALVTSTDAVTWSTRDSGFGTTNINAATYGFGEYVIAGNGGRISSSTDAITWTVRTSGTAQNINGLAFAARTFVFAAGNGELRTSGNAITWTARTANLGTNILRAAAYGLGLRWVVVGDNGVVATSDDLAVTWTARNSGITGSDLLTATYGRDRTYVIAGTLGRLATSNDGITWIQRTTGFGTETIKSVTFGDDLFVAVGNAGTIAASTDAVTWVRQTANFGTTSINSAIFSNNLFVAAGGGGNLVTGSLSETPRHSLSRLYVTMANQNWVARDALAGAVTWATAGYGDGFFIIGGSSNTFSTSTDGITWVSRTTGLGGDGRGLAYGNSVYVFAGTSGTLRTSTNSITWTARTSTFGATAINTAVYGNGLFVILGDSGQIRTSGDGITWTSRDGGFGVQNINAVTYSADKKLFIAVANTALISTSTDGILWTTRSSGLIPDINLRGVGYGDGRFLACGTAGTMLVSTNAIQWSPINANFGTTTINEVAYHRGLYVAVAEAGQLRTSTDTVTWTSRPSNSGNNLLGVTAAQSTYIAVGGGGHVRTKQQGMALVQIQPLVTT